FRLRLVLEGAPGADVSGARSTNAVARGADVGRTDRVAHVRIRLRRRVVRLRFRVAGLHFRAESVAGVELRNAGRAGIAIRIVDAQVVGVRATTGRVVVVHEVHRLARGHREARDLRTAVVDLALRVDEARARERVVRAREAIHHAG